MSRLLVEMVIANPEVHTGREVNLKPNLGTEQGLSPTVTQGVDLEVPHHLTDQEATREAGAEAGIAEAGPAAGAVPMEVSIATGELVISHPSVWHLVTCSGPLVGQSRTAVDLSLSNTTLDCSHPAL